MPASLDDLLTAQKNGVVAINNLGQTTVRGMGTLTSATVTTSTLVFTGPGYLVNFASVVAGTASGLVYDFASITSPLAANALCATPTTIGVYKAGQTFVNGLVIVPGTGQSINVTYATG